MTGAGTGTGAGAGTGSGAREVAGGGAFSGVVLAGGASRRMGRDKALVEVGGRPLVMLAVDALAAAGAAEVLVVGGDRQALGALGLTVVPDRYPGEGPLGALLTAFAVAREPMVAVLACDLPRVHAGGVAAVVAALAADETLAAVVPVSGDRSPAHGTTLSVPSRRHEARLEPLHAAYRVSACREPFGDAFLSGERAVHAALAEVRVRTLRLADDGWLANANTPADLASLHHP